MFKASLIRIAVLLVSITSAQAAQNPWQSTLNSIESDFEKIYCFKDLKRELFNWDSKRSMNEVREGISRLGVEPSPQAARRVLGHYFDSTRDIHVGARYNTKSPYSISRLPISVRGVGTGHFYLVGIDRTVLNEATYPLQVGDELLSIDGVPYQAWVDEYLPLFYAQKKTQQALAEYFALTRYDSLGRSMPTGVASVRVKRASRAIENYSMNWITTAKTPASHAQFISGKGMYPDFFKTDLLELTAEANPVANYVRTGLKKPFFPALGKVVWQSADTDVFHAYIFELPNHKLAGFVRVHTYYPAKITTVVLPAFFALVNRFVEANISVLIFDQTNNAGGSLLYAQGLLSALIDRPVKPTLKTEWIVNETHFEVGEKWSVLRDLAEKAKTDSAALEKFQNSYFNDTIVTPEFLDSFIAQANHMIKLVADPAHPRLSPAHVFEGVGVVRPNYGKHYTGPILMLNNELSISSADLAPALFQDLKRAVMFGSRTAGAGAYQNAFAAPKGNPYELDYYSISFGKFTRANGSSVENFGVSPDVSYAVTEADLKTQMSGYRAAVVQAATQLTR